MDHANRFDSLTTYRLIRGEYAVALGSCLGLLAVHLDEVRWVPAIAAFLFIDLIGYLPGLIAHLRRPGGATRRAYYVLYNTMHSFITQAVVLGLWGSFFGFEWAMLAIPIHLCGDRALFGNFMKPFGVPFEPKPHPAFAEFQRRFDGPVVDQPAQRCEELIS